LWKRGREDLEEAATAPCEDGRVCREVYDLFQRRCVLLLHLR
jgi:hypothetical protein